MRVYIELPGDSHLRRLVADGFNSLVLPAGPAILWIRLRRRYDRQARSIFGTWFGRSVEWVGPVKIPTSAGATPTTIIALRLAAITALCNAAVDGTTPSPTLPLLDSELRGGG